MKKFTFRVTQPLIAFYEGFIDINVNSEEEGRKLLESKTLSQLDELAYDWDINIDNASPNGNITIEELVETDNDNYSEDINEFIRLYKPELDEEGNIKLYETFKADLDYVNIINKQSPNKVWTLIDTDDLYIVPGYQFADRISYIICENPWNDFSKDYTY